jgi:hypothetical protein
MKKLKKGQKVYLFDLVDAFILSTSTPSGMAALAEGKVLSFNRKDGCTKIRVHSIITRYARHELYTRRDNALRGLQRWSNRKRLK